MLKNNEEQTRDRAFIRQVKIRLEDNARFCEFLDTLPENRLFSNFTTAGNFLFYNVKLKKQELLYIELAFKLDVKKHRKSKKAKPFKLSDFLKK